MSQSARAVKDAIADIQKTVRVVQGSPASTGGGTNAPQSRGTSPRSSPRGRAADAQGTSLRNGKWEAHAGLSSEDRGAADVSAALLQEAEQPLTDSRRDEDEHFLRMIRWRFQAKPKGALKKIWSQADEDGGGALECAEFVALCRRGLRIQRSECADADLSRLFQLLDSDGGGALQLSELLAFINQTGRWGMQEEPYSFAIIGARYDSSGRNRVKKAPPNLVDALDRERVAMGRPALGYNYTAKLASSSELSSTSPSPRGRSSRLADTGSTRIQSDAETTLSPSPRRLASGKKVVAAAAEKEPFAWPPLQELDGVGLSGGVAASPRAKEARTLPKSAASVTSARPWTAPSGFWMFSEADMRVHAKLRKAVKAAMGLTGETTLADLMKLADKEKRGSLDVVAFVRFFRKVCCVAADYVSNDEIAQLYEALDEDLEGVGLETLAAFVYKRDAWSSAGEPVEQVAGSDIPYRRQPKSRPKTATARSPKQDRSSSRRSLTPTQDEKDGTTMQYRARRRRSTEEEEKVVVEVEKRKRGEILGRSGSKAPEENLAVGRGQTRRRSDGDRPLPPRQRTPPPKGDASPRNKDEKRRWESTTSKAGLKTAEIATRLAVPDYLAGAHSAMWQGDSVAEEQLRNCLLEKSQDVDSEVPPWNQHFTKSFGSSRCTKSHEYEEYICYPLGEDKDMKHFEASLKNVVRREANHERPAPPDQREMAEDKLAERVCKILPDCFTDEPPEKEWHRNWDVFYEQEGNCKMNVKGAKCYQEEISAELAIDIDPDLFSTWTQADRAKELERERLDKLFDFILDCLLDATGLKNNHWDPWDAQKKLPNVQNFDLFLQVLFARYPALRGISEGDIEKFQEYCEANGAWTVEGLLRLMARHHLKVQEEAEERRKAFEEAKLLAEEQERKRQEAEAVERKRREEEERAERQRQQQEEAEARAEEELRRKEKEEAAREAMEIERRQTAAKEKKESQRRKAEEILAAAHAAGEQEAEAQRKAAEEKARQEAEAARIKELEEKKAEEKKQKEEREAEKKRKADEKANAKKQAAAALAQKQAEEKARELDQKKQAAEREKRQREMKEAEQKAIKEAVGSLARAPSEPLASNSPRGRKGESASRSPRGGPQSIKAAPKSPQFGGRGAANKNAGKERVVVYEDPENKDGKSKTKKSRDVQEMMGRLKSQKEETTKAAERAKAMIGSLLSAKREEQLRRATATKALKQRIIKKVIQLEFAWPESPSQQVRYRDEAFGVACEEGTVSRDAAVGTGARFQGLRGRAQGAAAGGASGSQQARQGGAKFGVQRGRTGGSPRLQVQAQQSPRGGQPKQFQAQPSLSNQAGLGDEAESTAFPGQTNDELTTSVQLLREVRWKLVKARYTTGAESFHELYEYLAKETEGDAEMTYEILEILVRKLMRMRKSELSDDDLLRLFKAMDYSNKDSISLQGFMRFTGLAAMDGATKAAKRKATVLKELDLKAQEDRHRLSEADPEAPWYGPWYPAGVCSIQDWKAPVMSEEEKKYVHAVITDALQQAWQEGQLGNQADWFFYCLFELYKVGRNFPEYVRELVCRLLSVRPADLTLKDIVLLCSEVDLDQRQSVFLGASVSFWALAEWLGFARPWWRARYKKLVKLRFKESHGRNRLPGVDSPVEDGAVTEISAEVATRPSSAAPSAT
eukprot:TRINITY_DN12868_c0_g1_i1.p1 TRINITY_DN12868_c0_g1~~TRINITY_DN12868_c0_g1_i1.p1  ORF type:complete len:1710 (-),score=473.91 TRINITY_DN12868_c0_g1_i1:270-5264(-)